MAKDTMKEFIQQVDTVLYRYMRKRGLAHSTIKAVTMQSYIKASTFGVILNRQ